MELSSHDASSHEEAYIDDAHYASDDEADNVPIDVDVILENLPGGLRGVIQQEGVWTADLLAAFLDKQHPGFSNVYLAALQQAQADALNALAGNPLLPVIQAGVNWATTNRKPILPSALASPSMLFPGVKLSKKHTSQASVAKTKWATEFATVARIAIGSAVTQDVQKKAKHPSDAGLQALLIHHQHVGFAALILGDISEIDPVIGDASCEIRCPFLLDMYQRVQAHLTLAKKLPAAQKLAGDFVKLHLNAAYEKNAREPKDIKPNSHDFDTLVMELSKDIDSVTAHATEYLGLCVTMSRSCIWRFDEFRTPYHFRDAATFYCTQDQHGNIVDHKLTYKQRLAELSTGYMVQIAHDRMLEAGSKDAGLAADEQSVEEMLYEVLLNSKARKKDKNAVLPLVPIYAAFRLIMIHEYAKGRPINVLVRRIRLGRDKDHAYDLDDVRLLHYVPDPDNLTYKFSDKIADPNLPCMTIDSFSVCTGQFPHYVDGTSLGLFEEDTQQYFDSLKSADLATLIQIYAAGHPPFTGGALMPSGDPRRYQQDLHLRSLKHEPYGLLWPNDRMTSPLSLGFMSNAETNLFDELNHFYKIAAGYELLDARQVVKEGSYVRRIARPVCFAPEHVKIWSSAQAIAYCDKLKADTHGKSYPAWFTLRDAKEDKDD